MTPDDRAFLTRYADAVLDVIATRQQRGKADHEIQADIRSNHNTVKFYAGFDARSEEFREAGKQILMTAFDALRGSITIDEARRLCAGLIAGEITEVAAA